MRNFAFDVTIDYLLGRRENKGTERTAILTSFALWEGLKAGDRLEDKLEVGIIRQLWAAGKSEFLVSYISALKDTAEPKEVTQRYYNIREEILTAKPDVLLIIAAGLSPLGYATARRLQQCVIMDTDLPAVIEYRGQQLGPGTTQLHQLPNYFLHTVNVLSSNDIHIAATALRGIESLKGKNSPSLCIVAEGLTYYLEPKEQQAMHHNFQRLARELHASSTRVLVDHYTDTRTTVERMKNTENIYTVDSTEKIFSIFDSLAKMQYSGDAASHEFLLAQGYRTVFPSLRNTADSPHRIWVAEM